MCNTMKLLISRHVYKYHNGLRLAFKIYLFTFIQKAMKRYMITGEPMVINDI